MAKGMDGDGPSSLTQPKQSQAQTNPEIAPQLWISSFTLNGRY